MKPVLIYALCDPRDMAFRYIGITTDIKRRLRQHIKNVGKENNHKSNWIKSLLALDLEPIMQTLFEFIPSVRGERNIIEINWIAAMRASGHQLTNLTNGGDGFDSERILALLEKLGPEGRSEKARKAMATLGAEGLSKRARKIAESLGSDGCRDRCLKAVATIGADGLKEKARKMNETLGPEGRSQRTHSSNKTLGLQGLKAKSRKAMITLGPNGLSDRSKKINENLGPDGRRGRANKGNETLGSEGRSERARRSRMSARKRSRNINPVGITFRKSHQKWLARTSVSEYGKKNHIGYYETLDQAIAALALYKQTNPPMNRIY